VNNFDLSCASFTLYAYCLITRDKGYCFKEAQDFCCSLTITFIKLSSHSRHRRDCNALESRCYTKKRGLRSSVALLSHERSDSVRREILTAKANEDPFQIISANRQKPSERKGSVLFS